MFNSIFNNDSIGGGVGTALTPEQTAAGAIGVAGMTNNSELVNPDGEFEVKAQIIPRNQPLSTLQSLTSGEGELASSSDTPHIAKLYGTPGSGQAYFYLPKPIYSYDYINQVNLVSGGLVGEYEDAFSALSIRSPIASGLPAGVIRYHQMTQLQKEIYASSCKISTSFGYGLVVGATSNYLKATTTVVRMKTRAIVWNEELQDFINDTTSAGLGTSTFSLEDDEGNSFITAQSSSSSAAPRLGLGNSPTQPIRITIGSAISTLSFFSVTAVAKRNLTNIGAGGPRVGTTGNAVTDEATFTGGLGTSGYTISQIVRALKQYGLLEL